MDQPALKVVGSGARIDCAVSRSVTTADSASTAELNDRGDEQADRNAGEKCGYESKAGETSPIIGCMGTFNR
jgi:hypothetical protein